MEIAALILIILGVIFLAYNHSSGEEKVDAYIKERGGTFVSKEREYFDVISMFSKNTYAYKLVYYDKHKVLRAVLVRFSSFGYTEFIDDHEVNAYDQKYFSKKVHVDFLKKEEDEDLVSYTYESDKGTLIIKQSFYQPNKGEKGFLNDKEAPDGKYKIGLMNYIVIENGKVKELTMF